MITHSITPYLEAVLAQRSIPVGHPSVASARPSAILDRVRRGLGDACWDDFNLVASALASYHAEAHAEMGRSIRCPVLLRDSHALCGRW